MTASKQSQDGTACSSILTVLGSDHHNLHETYQTPDDGQRSCPTDVEFCDRINLDKWCVWLVIKKKSLTTHGNMNVKCVMIRFMIQTFTEMPLLVLYYENKTGGGGRGLRNKRKKVLELHKKFLLTTVVHGSIIRKRILER
jgi:hypothetical protein